MTRKIIVALVAVTILAGAFMVRRHVRSLDCRQPPLTVIDDPAQLDDLHLELLELEPENWVRRYDPELSSAGYNLVFYRRRVPLIVDMNGRVVHSWPEVRATGRVRLNRDGGAGIPIKRIWEATTETETGAVWKNKVFDRNFALAVTRNAVVAAGRYEKTLNGQPSYGLAALDIDDGRVLWKHRLPACPVQWALAIDRFGRVIVSLRNGQVLCFG